LGAYYTSDGTYGSAGGSACAIQASDYYSYADHYDQSLLLNPQGGAVVIGLNLTMNGSAGAAIPPIDSVIQNNGAGGWLYLLATNGQGIKINSTGEVGIQTNPSTSYALSVGGTVYASTSFSTGSDYRIKDNVEPIDSRYTTENLRPVTYINKISGKQDIGLIAHELQEEYPFLVTGEKDGVEMQSVNYNGLIGILIKEIQDLKARVSCLESTFKKVEQN
jgi:hypothetical protein